MNARQSSHQIEQQFIAGTDAAIFHLYHPDDLQHRLAAPRLWPLYHFACRPEFEAGRLISFCNSGDGGYRFRVTNGGLTDREQHWLASSWDFRYCVRHGRVYLDGGDALPGDPYLDDSADHPEQWISLPNGNYRVRVNSIDWRSEPDAVNENGELGENCLPAYVIQFSPVDDFDLIEVPSTAPWLGELRGTLPQLPRSFAERYNFEEDETEIAGPYPAIVVDDQAPVPKSRLTVELSDEVREAITGRRGIIRLSKRIKEIVIATSDKVPCLGALADSGFRIKRFVTVKTLQSAGVLLESDVEALTRPESTVSPDQLEQLKRDFAAYAATSESYQAIPHAAFEAERAASMNSAAGLTHVLIQHLEMPLATRLHLLPLSDSERVDKLIELLKTLLGSGVD